MFGCGKYDRSNASLPRARLPRDFVSRVEVGMVGVNFAIPVPLAYYTFGEWKRSGFSDLNQHGPDAVRFYTKTKAVTAVGPLASRKAPSSSSRR